MSDNQGFALAEILQGQAYLVQRKKQLSEQLAGVNDELDEGRKLARTAIKNGETTGNKLRDAIIGNIGYSGKSIEFMLSVHLKARGVSVDDASTQIVLSDEELATLKLFSSLPDLSLSKRSIEKLEAVFGGNISKSAIKEMQAVWEKRNDYSPADITRIFSKMIDEMFRSRGA